MLEGIAYLDNSVYDCWRFNDQQFESGKIYGLVSFGKNLSANALEKLSLIEAC